MVCSQTVPFDLDLRRRRVPFLDRRRSRIVSGCRAIADKSGGSGSSVNWSVVSGKRLQLGNVKDWMDQTGRWKVETIRCCADTFSNFEGSIKLQSQFCTWAVNQERLSIREGSHRRLWRACGRFWFAAAAPCVVYLQHQLPYYRFDPKKL